MPAISSTDQIFDASVGRIYPRGEQMRLFYPKPGEPIRAELDFRSAVVATDQSGNPNIIPTGPEQVSHFSIPWDQLGKSFDLVDVSCNQPLGKTMTVAEFLVAATSFARYMMIQPGGGVVPPDA